MTELLLSNHSKICGYYIEETSRAVLIKLPNSISFWVPKRYLELDFQKSSEKLQDFIIENWILHKIGFN